MKTNLKILVILFLLFYFFNYNIFGQDCNPIGISFFPGKAILDNSPTCAPTTAQIWVKYQNVNDLGIATNAAIEIDWDDGTPVQIIDFGDVGLYDSYLYTAATHKHELTISHTYPANTTLCEYVPQTYLRVNGDQCPGTDQAIETIYNWDTDDQGGGTLSLLDGKLGGNVYYICENVADTIWFEDNSTLNCNLSLTNVAPNTSQRWIQFEYGTGTWGDADRIPNVVVGSTTVTNATGAVTPYSDPVETYIPPSPYNSRGDSTKYIIIPAAGKTSGQRFQITLHYWNFCNAYPGGTSVTTTATIEIITKPPDIGDPSQEFCVGDDITVTVTPFFGGGTSTIKWYNDIGLTTLLKSSTTDFTFDATSDPVNPAFRLPNTVGGQKSYYVTETLNSSGCESSPTTVSITVRDELSLSAINYTGDNSVCQEETGVLYSLGSAAPASQTHGGATEYVWTKPADWTQSGSSSYTKTYDIGTATGTQTISAIWQYTTAPACPSTSKSYNVTVNALPVCSLYTTTANLCGYGYSGGTSGGDPGFRIFVGAATGTSSNTFTATYTDGTTTYNYNGGSSFSGTPAFTTSTYTANLDLAGGQEKNYTLVTVNNTTNGCSVTAPHANLTGTATVRVREVLPLPGAITGPTAVCNLEQDIEYTLGTAPQSQTIGGNTRYRWEETSDWLNWNDGTPTVTANNETDSTQLIDVRDIVSSGTSTRRIRVAYEYNSSPTCQHGWNNLDVTVYSLPSAVISGTTTICNGNTATLSFTVTNGPVDIIYSDGTNNYNLNNVNSTTDVTPALTADKTYTITSVQRHDAPTCSGTSSGSAVITVNDLPTAGITDGTSEICETSDGNVEITLTGEGTGDWEVGYKINGGTTQKVSVSSSPYTLTIASGSLIYGVNTILLVSVTQDKGAVCSGSIVGGQETYTITKYQLPQATDAGDNDEFCGSTSENLNADAPSGGIGTGAWTFTGKPTGADDPVIDNAASRTSNVTITPGHWGRYTFKWTISNGVCPVQEDTVIYDMGGIQSDPDAGSDSSTCFPLFGMDGNTPVIGDGEWSGDGPGSIDFDNDEDPTSDVTVSATGTYEFYWTISSGACADKIDTVEVTFYPNPTVNAGDNDEICELNSFTVSTATASNINGDPTWSAFPGGGIWADQNTTTPTYTPSAADKAAGSVTLTISANGNGNCASTSDNMTLTISEQPVTSAGADGYACDSSYTLEAVTDVGTGIWSIVSGPGVVEDWGTSQTQENTTATVSIYGEYEFVWTETNGSCTDKDTTVINFYEIPTADAGVTLYVCDDTVATLQGTGYNYKGLPNVDYEEKFWLLNVAGSNPNDNTPLFSDNTSPTSDVSFSKFGTYSLRFVERNTTNCVDRDTTFIILSEQPTADAGDSIEVCGSKSTTLDGTGYTYLADGNQNNGARTWEYVSGPDNTPTFATLTDPKSDVTVDFYGTYKFRFIETNNNCQSADTVVVIFYEQPNANAGSDIEVCGSLNRDLAGTGYSYTGGSNVNYSTRTWEYISGPDNSPIFTTINDPATNVAVDYYGSYTFRFVETNGSCENADTVQVIFYQQPDAIAGSDIQVCGTLSTNLGGTGFSYLGGNNVNYGTRTWQYVSGPDATPTFTTANNPTTNVTVDYYGTYKFRFEETNGTCQDADTVEVIFYQQPTANAGTDRQECNSKSLALAGTSFSYAANPNVNYGTRTWQYISGPDNTPTFGTITSPTSTVTIDYWGSYELRFVETNGTCTDADTVVVSFYQRPTVSAGSSENVCNSKTTTLEGLQFTYAASPNVNYSNLLWEYNDGPDASPVFGTAGNDTTTVTVALWGAYEFKLTEFNGSCTSNVDIISVNFYEQPIADAGAGGDICDALTFELDANEYSYAGGSNENSGSNTWQLVSAPTGGNVTSWGSGQGNANTTITVNLYGTYRFQWIETNGTCEDRDTITVSFWQSPIANSGSDGITCQGNEFDFSNLTTLPSAFNYDSLLWSFTGGVGTAMGSGTLQNANTLYPTYVPGINETGDAEFTLRVYPQGNCVAAIDQMTLSIKPSPSTSAITGNEDVCVSSTRVYSVTEHTGSSYNWFLSNSSPLAPTKTPINHQLILAYKSSPWNGIIYVIETSSNGCIGDTMSMNVQSYNIPVIEAGTNAEICNGDTTILGGSPNGTNNTATGGSGKYLFTWTPSTGLSDQLVSNPYAHPPLTVTYTLQVTDSISGCVSSTDQVKVTVNAIPSKPTVTSATVCYGLPNPALTATGSNITWYDDALLTSQVGTGNSYTPAVTATGSHSFYATQKTGLCESAASTATLTIYENPVISIDTFINQSVCNSNDGSINLSATGALPFEYSINGGTTWQSSGQFNNLGNGQYPTVVKNVFNCVDYGDTVEIGSGDAPIAPIAGTNATYCEGDAMVNLQAVKQSDGTITWYSDPGLTAIIASGVITIAPYNTVGITNYYVTETSGGCESPATAVTITINAIPDPPVADDVTICYGDAVPDLTATGTNIKWYTNPRLTGTPYSGSSYTTGQTSGTVNYYVTQTVNNCASDAEEVILAIKTKPSTLSVDDKSICYGQATPSFTAIGTDVKWYDNLNDLLESSNSFTPSDDAVGTYDFHVTQTVEGCSSDPEYFTYTIKALPAAPASSDTFACVYASPKPKLSATGETGSTIKWYRENYSFLTSGTSPSILNISHNVVDTTYYHVTQTVNGCESPYEDVHIIIYAKPSDPATTDVTVCKGETGTLYASSSDGGQVLWYDRFGTTFLSSGNYYTPGETAPADYDYSVKVEKNDCYSNLKGATLTINPAPSISNIASTNETACASEDATITITASSLYQTPNTLKYSINGGTSYDSLNSGAFTGLKDGHYPVIVKNLYNCSIAGDTVEISDNGAPPMPAAGNNATYCQGASYSNLFASASTGGLLVWYRDLGLTDSIGNGPTFAPFNTAGTTYYYVTERSGDCESTPNTVTIAIYPLPTSVISGSTEICQGDSALITVNLTGTPPFNFIYNDGYGHNKSVTTSNTIYTFFVKTAGTYTITSLSDAHSCSATSKTGSAAITVNPLPSANISPLSPATVCKGYSLSLDGNPGGGAGGYEHTWTGSTGYLSSDTVRNPVFRANLTGNYKLYYEVTDVKGCQADDSINISVLGLPIVSVLPASPANICASEDLQLTASASGGLSPYSYNWTGHTSGLSSSSISNPVFNKDDANNYSLNCIVTDYNGCKDTSVLLISVNSVPTAPVTQNKTICQGEATPQLYASGLNIKWYNNSSLTILAGTGNYITPTETTPGIYTYYATQTTGICESSGSPATFTIRQVPDIVSQVAEDQTVCDNADGKITLVAQGGEPLTYSINGGLSWELSGTFENLTNADYPVMVKNTYSCITYGDTLEVRSGDQPVAPDAGTDAVYCYGDDVDDMIAAARSGGVLTWYGNANLTDTLAIGPSSFSPYIIVGTRTYYITEKAGGCESEPATVTITINAIPSVPAADDEIVCTGDVVPDLYAEGTNIKWYRNIDLSDVPVTGNTLNTGITDVGNHTFYVTQTINNCESPSSQVLLQINQRPVSLSVSNQVVCYGQIVQSFNASGTNVIWYTQPENTIIKYGDTFTPDENQPGIYTYTVTQTSNSCESYPDTVKLTIYSIPQPPDADDVSVCEDETIPNLTATGTNITWYTDPSLASNKIASTEGTLVHGQVNVGTYIWYVTQTVNTCRSSSKMVTLRIKDKPSLPTANNTAFCEGETPVAQATGASGATFDWYNNTSTYIGSGSPYTLPITNTGDYTYYVRQVVDGCESDPEDVIVNYYSITPITSIDVDTVSNCVAQDGVIRIYPSNSTYRYSIDGGKTIVSNNFGIFSGLKNGLYPTILYRVHPNKTCPYYGDTVEIVDKGAPNPPIVHEDKVYCKGEYYYPMTAQSDTTPAGTIKWYSDPGLTNVLGTGNIFTPLDITGETVYYISETSDSSCESSPSTLTITIHERPTSIISGSNSICDGDTTLVNVEFEGIAPWSFTYTDNNGRYTSALTSDTTYLFSVFRSGVYQVTQLTDSTGCTATQMNGNANITVNPLPIPNITPVSPSYICNYNTLNLNGNPVYGTSPYNHQWYGDTAFLNSTIIQNPVFTSFGSGNYTIYYRVTDDNGCNSVDSILITVNKNPSTALGPGPMNYICEGSNLQLTALTTSGKPPYQHNWTGNIANISNRYISNPVFTGTEGIYGYRYYATDANNCRVTDTMTIDVSLVLANIINDTIEVYVNEDTVIQGNPSGGSHNYKHVWTGQTTFIDNTNRDSVTFNSTTVGSYNLNYKVTDLVSGCYGEDNVVVMVYGNPVLLLSPKPANVCAGIDLTLRTNVSGGTGPYDYYWTGSTEHLSAVNQSQVTFNCSVAGTYNYTCQVTDSRGRQTTDNITVTVYSNPVSALTDSLFVCKNSPLGMNGSPSGGSGTYITHKWAGISVGSNLLLTSTNTQSTSFTSSTPGFYRYIYTVTDSRGCKAQDTVVVDNIELPSVDFMASENAGCSPLLVSFTNLTTGADVYSWDFGDGSSSTDENPDNTYTNTANTISRRVILTSTNSTTGCWNSNYLDITIYPELTGDIQGKDSICPYESPLRLDGYINRKDVSYVWKVNGLLYDTIHSTIDYNFINNSSTSDSVYTITLIRSSLTCSDTANKQVTVHYLPVASFNLNASAGCSPFNVTFNNLSTDALSSYWNFDDGKPETEINQTSFDTSFINATNFNEIRTIGLVVENDYCRSVAFEQNITVYPPVKAAFQIEGDSAGCSPLSTYFKNSSENITQGDLSEWDFGDGTANETGYNKFHTFNNTTTTDRNYTVWLNVTSGYGCTDSVSGIVTVYPSPVASFSVDETSGCSDFTITVTNNTTNIIQSVWDFGDVASFENNSASFSHLYKRNTNKNSALYNLKLTVYNGRCYDDEIQVITVKPYVDASFLVSKDAVCSENLVVFTNTSKGVDVSDKITWNFGDNTSVSSDFETSHTFFNYNTDEVTYKVILEVQSELHSCSDTVSSDIVVYPSPLSSFETDSTVYHVPNKTVIITNNNINSNFSYKWEFGDGNSSNEINPGSHIYQDRGKYTIALTVTNNSSVSEMQCPGISAIDIWIKYPPPTASFSSVPAGCAPYEVNFVNNSTYSLSYMWDINEGQIAFAEKNPSYTFIDTGFIPVKLTAYGEDGLTDDTIIDIRVYPQIIAEFSVIPRLAKVKEDEVGFFPALNEENVEIYLWNFGDDSTSNERNPQHIYLKKGLYDVSLEVWNQYGCYNKKIKLEEVNIIASDSLGFPTAFIPMEGVTGENYPGSTTNTMFYPVNVDGVDIFTLEIYNRWGILIRIVETINEAGAWDGHDQSGNIVDEDVYVWKVTVKYKDGNVSKQVGTVTVLRKGEN